MLVSNTTKEENREGTFQVASEHRQLHRCGFVVLPQLLAHKVALESASSPVQAYFVTGRPVFGLK